MPDDPFYVGYLPAPAPDRRFLRWVLPALLAAVAVAGLAVGTGQKDPGTGTWELDKEITIEGTVSVRPYAMLHIPERHASRTLVVVEEGKFGAADRLRPFDGRSVSLRGTLLHRDGRQFLELAHDGIQSNQAAPTLPAILALGTKRLTGEVIDPKCYVGAMKPGGGKTHKACAELCLAGGIPPMLATWQDGREVFYLLLHADGTAANTTAAPLAGETVTLTGAVEQRGDLLCLLLPQRSQENGVERP